ncbi:hypothetical protein GCM10009557_36760 [Virgisporangium ochraceum]|uniref:Uncharacterized protein n=1 Tax=Virgisporangium ochraceum TaxID=65505 RepID=A0A8J4EEG5_9ACTN|nr:hypothetical protein Voc01_066560 [Virgisporangium ochraceum]
MTTVCPKSIRTDTRGTVTRPHSVGSMPSWQYGPEVTTAHRERDDHPEGAVEFDRPP